MRHFTTILSLALFTFGCRKIEGPSLAGLNDSEPADLVEDTVGPAIEAIPETEYADTIASDNEDTGPEDDSVWCHEVVFDRPLQGVNLLVLLDRSSAMNQVGADGLTYEAMVDEALTELASNPPGGYVSFGLAAFPSRQCDSAAPDAPDSSCAPTDEVLAPWGPGSREVFIEQLSILDTCGGAPLCDSLDWLAEQYLEAALAPDALAGPAVLLIITATPPGCGEAGDIGGCESIGGEVASSSQCLDDACAKEQLARIHGMGAEIVIVGVGETVARGGPWEAVMDDMAAAASGGGQRYFPVSDASELRETLRGVFVQKSSTCVFYVEWEEISGPLRVTKGCNLVRVYETDETETPELLAFFVESRCEDHEGWFWQGMTGTPDFLTPLEDCMVIELCPESCRRFKDEAFESITAKFGCVKATPRLFANGIEG